MGIKKELTKDIVLKIIENYGNDPQQLIAILLDIQAASGRNYVDRKWAELTACKLNLPLSKVFEILTFYAMFSITPRGEYLIEICQSAPCHFCNADNVIGWFEAAVGIKIGETSADGKITLERTSCVGACEIGPVAKIGDDIYGNLDEEKVQYLAQCCRENTLKGAVPCQN